MGLIIIAGLGGKKKTMDIKTRNHTGIALTVFLYFGEEKL